MNTMNRTRTLGMSGAFKAVAVLAVLAGLSAPAFALPAGAYFDPTGSSSFVSGTTLANLDWLPGNILAQGATTAVQNFIATGGSLGASSPAYQFTEYYQATLQTYGLFDGSNTTQHLMPGVTSLTIVGGINESVVAASGGVGSVGATAQFQFNASPSNFFEIYANTTTPTDTQTLAGQGFNSGTLVLRANISGVAQGAFTLLNATPQALDQDGANNYPGITTLSGHESATLTATVTDYDPAYFDFISGAPITITTTMLQDLSTDDPFITVNPSSAFDESANLGAEGSTGLGPAPVAGGAGVSIGTVNGAATTSGGGPDQQFQTNNNESFLEIGSGTVPEPLTASLGGMGLIGLALGTLRRRRA